MANTLSTLKKSVSGVVVATIFAGSQLFAGGALANHHEAGSTGSKGKSVEKAKKQSNAAESGSTSNVSKKELKAFADAQTSLKKIQMEYKKELQNDGKKSGKNTALRSKYQRKMQSAVTNSGLSLKEYNSIAKSLTQDKKLMERFRKVMQ